MSAGGTGGLCWKHTISGSRRLRPLANVSSSSGIISFPELDEGPSGMQYASPRFANFTFAFQRVNVILGANGSGKSKLLTEIKDQAAALTGGAKVAYIEGGRTIKIKDVLQLDHTNVGAYDRYDSALAHYFNKRVTSLADRVFDALVVLDKRDAHLKGKHSDAVDQWLTDGRRCHPGADHRAAG